MAPLRGACVSRTPVKSSIFAEDTFSCSTFIIVVFCHPATTSTRFSSRNRRHIPTTSRFPNTTLPSSPSQIPRATTTTATRFPCVIPPGFAPSLPLGIPPPPPPGLPSPPPGGANHGPITAQTSAATCDVRGRDNGLRRSITARTPYTC